MCPWRRVRGMGTEMTGSPLREEAELTMVGLRKLAKAARLVNEAHPSVEIVAVVAPIRMICIMDCYQPEDMPMPVESDADVPDTTIRFKILGQSRPDAESAARYMTFLTRGMNARR